ncbi:MAG: serine/threonine protein kinase, partial [Myxococcales bacterium]|nr:serine/threonine protein kinase [Myxococcales bacterium]
LGKEEDRYYIAMEFVDGLDLYQLLRRLRKAKEFMPPEVAAYIISEVSAGLAYAHERKDEDGNPLGVIHRDISPQNVLVSHEGDVKIIDFGIAKAKARAQTTGVGIIKGKFSYMSPEQARGKPLDHRSDLFAGGVLFYELLTNRMLYDSDSARDALRLAKAGRFLPPSSHRGDLPDSLERIVLKMLARETENRYQSAHEIRSDLSAWLRANSPGFGRHRLESYLSETIEVKGKHRVARLARQDYLIQPNKSVIFKTPAEPELYSREESGRSQATRQIQAKSLSRPADNAPSGRQTAETGPPPLPQSNSTRPIQAPDLSARPLPGQSWTTEPDALRERVRAAREKLGLGSTGENDAASLFAENKLDLEPNETQDVFSAPTAVVHLPSVPTGDLYSGDFDTTDETPRPSEEILKGAVPSNAEDAYRQVREAMAARRAELESARNPKQSRVPALPPIPSTDDTRDQRVLVATDLRMASQPQHTPADDIYGPTTPDPMSSIFDEPQGESQPEFGADTTLPRPEGPSRTIGSSPQVARLELPATTQRQTDTIPAQGIVQNRDKGLKVALVVLIVLVTLASAFLVVSLLLNTDSPAAEENPPLQELDSPLPSVTDETGSSNTSPL